MPEIFDVQMAEGINDESLKKETWWGGRRVLIFTVGLIMAMLMLDVCLEAALVKMLELERRRFLESPAYVVS